MTGDKAGVVAALETLEATAEPGDDGAGEQLDLLPSLPAAQVDGQAVERRGPGRPPGARNKSTEAWRAYLLQRFGSPLEALLSIATADTRQLGRDMGLKPAEAFGHQVKALEAALPYLHQKLPQAVEVQGEGAVLNLVVSQEVYAQVARPAQDGEVRLEAESEGNQGVGDDDDA